MAITYTASAARVQAWDDDFFTEYVRESRWRPYMGESENSIIQVKNRGTGQWKRGDRFSFNLVGQLTNSGVTGSNMMEGNEEALDQYAFLLSVDKIRNAVLVPELEEIKNAIDLRDAARQALKTWISKDLRDKLTLAAGEINGVAFSTSTQAQRDAWLDYNYDRALFGATLSNTDSTGGTVAYDFSDSLATIDNTSDKLTPAAVSLMKRIAQSASPMIQPIRTKGDEEWYVLLVNRLAMRDLKENTTMAQANRDARERGKDNPLFTGADLVWDGVIIREFPEIPITTNGTIAVAPVYLMGAQSMAMGWARRSRSVTKMFDYDDKWGVEMSEIRGMGKIRYNYGDSDATHTKDTGIVTGWFAAVAD
jgi:hypothetical protein